MGIIDNIYAIITNSLLKIGTIFFHILIRLYADLGRINELVNMKYKILVKDSVSARGINFVFRNFFIIVAE